MKWKGKNKVPQPVRKRTSVGANALYLTEDGRLEAAAYYTLIDPVVFKELNNENGKMRKALSHGLYPVIQIRPYGEQRYEKP